MFQNTRKLFRFKKQKIDSNWSESGQRYPTTLFSSLFSLENKKSGGEGEIRTPGPLTGSTVFKTAAFDRSATSPIKHNLTPLPFGCKRGVCYLVDQMSVTENFEFPWPSVKVVLDGNSTLDLPRLELKTMEEATSFIQAYGFDPNNFEDSELIWHFFENAIQFIEKVLVDPERPTVPEHLRNRKSVTDIRRILLLASDRTGNPDQVFACAILRVMHVMIHLAYDPRLKFFQQMQTQVLARLDRYLYTDAETGVTYLGKKEEGRGIKLLFFKKKERKDRDREIIKLLHKAESVVEEIYDRVGIRFVTETKLEALKAVRLLLEKNIISLPNIRPGRSRNRLLDIKRVMFEMDRIIVHMKKTSEPAPYVEKMIKRLERRIGTRRIGRSLINPHTSEHYRAIQFTCRELVKVHNPMHQAYQNLAQQLSNLPGKNQILHEVFPTIPPPHEHGFFPYEIQIMDVKAYADSIFGKSNHEEYRRKQLEAARCRVFGKIAPDLE